jgi:hypothetical protein
VCLGVSPVWFYGVLGGIDLESFASSREAGRRGGDAGGAKQTRKKTKNRMENDSNSS